MKLIEYQVKDFVAALASGAAAPGGGSAAALMGSLGAALTAMVANLTTGKEKFQDQAPLVREVLKTSQELVEDLLVLVDRDTDAFNKVSDAFALPKTSDGEKTARTAAIQAALKFATEVPYDTMDKAAAALKVVARCVDNTNPAALSDLGVAALTLAAAVQGAWLNVLINLGGIKDQEFVDSYKLKGQRLVTESTALAFQLQKDIEARI